MDGARKVSLSLSAFVLICFFLPWVQLSCVGMEDSVSGYSLARSGDRFLWFIPLAMATILIAGVMRSIWHDAQALFAMANLLGGGLSAYVMYYERVELDGSPRLVATQWTALFWLAFVGCLVIAIAPLLFYFTRWRSP